MPVKLDGAGPVYDQIRRAIRDLGGERHLAARHQPCRPSTR